MRFTRRVRRQRTRKKPSKPMNVKSMIAVGCMGFCGCLLLFVLWYYYPYHELQFFVQKTDIDQEHYTKKLVQMNIHPKYEHWITRHNKNNESLHNISSINNNYNPFNKESISHDERITLHNAHAYNDDELKNIFLQYLQPLCIKKNILSHDYLSKALPDDCNDLLLSMINITTHHSFNQNEIHALAQRMEYLMDIVPQNGLYLLIHIPHTAMQSIISHVISPNYKENQILHCDQNDISPIKTQSPKDIKIAYGQIPFGFDDMFISNDTDTQYVLSVDELERIEAGDDENGKLKDVWINKLNFTYYTMLREPIDFVMAQYYDGDNRDKYTDLDDFVDHKVNRNIMIKYVSGSDLTNDEKNVNGNDYIMARNNLLSMGWIGIFDNVQESVDQLIHFWQLDTNQHIDMNKKAEMNRNLDKPLDITLSINQHQTILKRNKWDVMLYELAVVMYQQQQIVVKYKFSE